MIGALVLGLSMAAAQSGPAVTPFQKPSLAITRGGMNEIMPGMIRVKLRVDQAAQLQRDGKVRASESGIVPGGTFVSRIGPTGWTMWRVDEATDIRGLARKLMSRKDVVYAEPVNRIYPLFPAPNDADYDVWELDPLVVSDEGTGFRRLWHLDDTNTEQAWAIWPNTWYTMATKPANAPLIAVIDTGCDLGHPDFVNPGGFGPDVSQGGQWVMSLCKQFHLGEVDPNGSPYDAHGHGTHVAGIALAAGNNGAFDGHGVIGAGFNCRGMMLRVFDDGGVGTDSDAAAAMFYAADNGAEILSISLGTENYSQLFQDATSYAFQKGSLVVAAGNEDGDGGGDLGPIYPAACTSALAVTANGADKIPATDTYAGYGYYVDVAAPGGDAVIDFGTGSYTIQFVWSTAMRTEGALFENPILYPPYSLNYAYLAGTSMATPIVSGAAGLYLGKNNIRQQDGWGNFITHQQIEASAEGVMGAPYGGREDLQGYGSLDAEALLGGFSTRGAQVGGIKGKVYNNTTPVGNVEVRAIKIGGSTQFSTTTHSDGTYRLEALPPGVYNVFTSPFGAAKAKHVPVILGADTPAADFWCGTFTWDTTEAVVPRLQVSNVQTTGLDVRHWAYDVETGIDLMQFRIGTAQGGNDVMGDLEVYAGAPNVHLNVTLQPGVTYWLRGRYVNGGNIARNVDVQFQTASTTTNVAPNAYNVLRGSVVSGGLAQLASGDDSRLVLRNGAVLSPAEFPITVVIDGTSPLQTVSQLKLKYEGNGSYVTLLQNVDMFDFQANAWVGVDTRQATTSDSSILITATTPNRFIQPATGLVRCRVKYKANGPVLSNIWQGRLDQVQWQVTQ
jgi:subtilisin family serine protease